MAPAIQNQINPIIQPMVNDSNGQYSKFTVTASDGINLQGLRYKPQKSICSLIVVHGVGEHSKRYRSFAEKICSANISCYFYDHRGHGNSDGKRGHVARFEDYSNDLLKIYNLVFSESQGQPIILYGHSMGSIVATLFSLEHQAKLRGLILTGFALNPSIPLSGFSLKLIQSLSKATPLISIPTMINVKDLSHDQNVWEAYDQDRLTNKTVTLSWVAEFYSTIERIRVNLGKLKLPILIMHGSDDKIAKLKGAEQAVQVIASKDKTFRIFEGQRHELLNELPPTPGQVTDVITGWVKQRINGS